MVAVRSPTDSFLDAWLLNRGRWLDDDGPYLTPHPHRYGIRNWAAADPANAAALDMCRSEGLPPLPPAGEDGLPMYKSLYLDMRYELSGLPTAAGFWDGMSAAPLSGEIELTGATADHLTGISQVVCQTFTLDSPAGISVTDIELPTAEYYDFRRCGLSSLSKTLISRILEAVPQRGLPVVFFDSPIEEISASILDACILPNPVAFFLKLPQLKDGALDPIFRESLSRYKDGSGDPLHVILTSKYIYGLTEAKSLAYGLSVRAETKQAFLMIQTPMPEGSVRKSFEGLGRRLHAATNGRLLLTKDGKDKPEEYDKLHYLRW